MKSTKGRQAPWLALRENSRKMQTILVDECKFSKVGGLKDLVSVSRKGSGAREKIGVSFGGNKTEGNVRWAEQEL